MYQNFIFTSSHLHIFKSIFAASMSFKDFARSVLTFLHLDLTKNLQYDRLTNKILKQNLRSDSNCLDIGCHKGEILELMLKLAPNGKHACFEPIPVMFAELQNKFGSRATIYPYALSDQSGNTTFQFVKNAPAYSGLNQRAYAIANPEIEEIQVEVKTLDELIPDSLRIDLIKIDVEGGEFKVLKGAKETLKRNQPLVVFECGLGASDYYGTDPKELFDFVSLESGLKINTLKGFIEHSAPLSSGQFVELYQNNREYYFVASK